jgi:hypothetical protein
MASTTSTGNYYKNRTKKYLESKGYTVQLTEFLTTRIIGPGKFIYVKKDVFGSDGIAMNGEEIIFWNSKATTKERGHTFDVHKYQGKTEFSKYPFPVFVKRKLYIWVPRKEPIIIDCL